MEAKAKRKINSGYEYDSLFPAADLKDETVKKGATVEDTVGFIPKVVNDTLEQTKKIAKILKGETLFDTCKNIWHFVYRHINYHKDEEGLEQIRSPGRTWHDRVRGVDCDCYTVFISSILTNLHIPHKLRIVKYSKEHFQHIYPIVPTENGNYLTLDCVVDRFNYEEPFTEKKDTTMDLQYLSGTENMELTSIQELLGGDDFDGLGRRKRKLFNFLKKTVHVTNRLNPATMLLRNGVLASMKLNLFKVAQRLKYAYLSDAEAQKRGIDLAKFARLKKVKEKLENIFYGAGGKPENLKAAILTGKGNRDRSISGLGILPVEAEVAGLNENMPLSEILGQEIYHSENLTGMEGTEGLGEPATAASITAASGAVAAIAGLLKAIGSIFKRKEKGSEDFENVSSGEKAPTAAETASESKGDGSSVLLPSAPNPSDSSYKSSSADESGGGSGGGSSEENFWNKNKKWLKPTLFGVGGLTVLYVGYRLLSGKQHQQPPRQLSGIKSKKKKVKHKKPIVLM